MNRVSSRTVILLLLLLAAVVVYQYRPLTPSPRAGAVWIANEPVDLSQSNGLPALAEPEFA